VHFNAHKILFNKQVNLRCGAFVKGKQYSQVRQRSRVYAAFYVAADNNLFFSQRSHPPVVSIGGWHDALMLLS